MWGYEQLEAGMSGISRGASFVAGLLDARSKRAWQKYNNAMVNIANGQNQNAITTNENLTVERSVVQGFEIERTGYQTTAAIEAIAAASDTEGRSVNQTLFQAARNEAVAQNRRKSDLDAQLLGFDNDRRTSAFQAATQVDHTYIPNPSPAAFLLGLGSDALKLRMQYEE
jgi:hypothetical protein